MQALDTMRYAPEELTVKSGQTVRFIATNAGKQKHEFAIGDAEEQRRHAEMMKEMPDMTHKRGNAVSLVQNGMTKASAGLIGSHSTRKIRSNLVRTAIFPKASPCPFIIAIAAA